MVFGFSSAHWCLFFKKHIILSLVYVSFLFSLTPTWAFKVAITGFHSPHLGKKGNHRQLQIFSKILNQYRQIKVISKSKVQRVIRINALSNEKLNPLKNSSKAVRLMCSVLDVDVLLSVNMKLGTHTHPAYLESRFIACVHQKKKTHLKRYAFSGKLSKKVWRNLSKTIISPLKESRFISFSPTYPPTSPPPSSPYLPSPNYPPSPSSPPLSPSIPLANSKRFDSPLSPPLSSYTSPQSSKRPSLRLWGGISFMNRNLKYETQPSSPILKGGIFYSSIWFPGMWFDTEISPFYSFSQKALQRFSLVGHLESYKVISFHILPNLFDEDDRIPLQSAFNKWSIGGRYTHDLFIKQRSLLLSLDIRYVFNQLDIEKNIDYLGHTTQGVQLRFVTQMNLVEDYFWMTISGDLTPWMDFAKGQNSFGREVDAFGAGYALGMTYRTQFNLALNVGIHSWNAFYYPKGIGLNGRVGKDVTDQTLQMMIKVGWVGFGSSP